MLETVQVETSMGDRLDALHDARAILAFLQDALCRGAQGTPVEMSIDGWDGLVAILRLAESRIQTALDG